MQKELSRTRTNTRTRQTILTLDGIFLGSGIFPIKIGSNKVYTIAKIKQRQLSRKKFWRKNKKKNEKGSVGQKVFLHGIFKTNLIAAVVVEVQTDNLIKNPGTNELEHIFTIRVRTSQKIYRQLFRGRGSSIICVNWINFGKIVIKTGRELSMIILPHEHG